MYPLSFLFSVLLFLGAAQAQTLILSGDPEGSLSPVAAPEPAKKVLGDKDTKVDTKPEVKKESENKDQSEVKADKKDEGYHIKSSYGLFFNADKDVNWIEFFLKVYLPEMKKKESVKDLPVGQAVTDEVAISGLNSYTVNVLVTKKDDKNDFDVKIVKSVPPLPIKVPKEVLDKALGAASPGITVDFDKILKSPEVLALKEGEETKLKISAEGKEISFSIKKQGGKYVVNKSGD